MINFCYIGIGLIQLMGWSSATAAQMQLVSSGKRYFNFILLNVSVQSFFNKTDKDSSIVKVELTLIQVSAAYCKVWIGIQSLSGLSEETWCYLVRRCVKCHVVNLHWTGHDWKYDFDRSFIERLLFQLETIFFIICT